MILVSVVPAAMQEGAMTAGDSSELALRDPAAETPSQEFNDFERSVQERPQFAITTADSVVPDPLQDLSPIILPITWGAVVGTLIWRGKVRSQWSRQGYDYDTFRLVAKMRGSATRVELLNAIIDSPKNKLQLARDLGVDWKTIDNHVEMLLKNGLVEERMSIGTSKYYSATKHANKILSLLKTLTAPTSRNETEILRIFYRSHHCSRPIMMRLPLLCRSWSLCRQACFSRRLLEGRLSCFAA